MSNSLAYQREAFLRSYKMKDGPLNRMVLQWVKPVVATGNPEAGRLGGGSIMYSFGPVSVRWKFDLLIAGKIMEDTAQLVEAAKREMQESREAMSRMKDEVIALSEILHPQLMQQAREIRTARIAVVSEVRETMSAMHDVRKFFLHADYETEMARLERFVKVCREIQALKSEGVFDAICDSAIRLAVQEPSR